MTAQTGMSDKVKLESLKRLVALYKSAVDLINEGSRSEADTDLVLDAMQAFKEGRLVRMMRPVLPLSAEAMFERFNLRFETLPLSKAEQRYLAQRGIRYVGELYYVFFDPRSKPSTDQADRLFTFLDAHLGLGRELRPLDLGWEPEYWNQPWFHQELNALILARAPTGLAPVWELVVQRRGKHVFVAHHDHPETRGLARAYAAKNIHHIGEVLRGESRNKQCPVNMRSTGALERLRAVLRSLSMTLWASALVPHWWTPPSPGSPDVWESERQAIADERVHLAAAFAEFRRAEEQKRAAALAKEEAHIADLKRHWPDRPIEQLGLPDRILAHLLERSFTTIPQLVMRTGTELTNDPNFGGHRCLVEVIDVLEKFGLRLGTTSVEVDEARAKAREA